MSASDKQTITIEGFKKSFSVLGRYLNIDQPDDVHKYLLSHYRMYVTSQGMQRQVWVGKYKVN
jgi:hypothetical protein